MRHLIIALIALLGSALSFSGLMRSNGRMAATGTGFVLIAIALSLSGCCSSTLQRGCDPMPKWKGYTLEYRP